MRSNGPLILAVLFLAAGLTVIFHYGMGSAEFNAAYPFSAANLQLSIATTGPAAIGGLVLTAVGALLLVWALLGAIVGVLSGFGSGDAEERLYRRGNRRGEVRAERFERARLEQERELEHTERAALEQDRLAQQEDRGKVSLVKE